MRPADTSLAVLLFSSLSFAAPSKGPLIDSIAGGGPDDLPAIEAQLAHPSSVANGPDGSFYVSALYNIYRVDPSGRLHVVAGDGTNSGPLQTGPAASQGFAHPGDLAVDAAGNIYVASFLGGEGAILRIDAVTGLKSVYAGTGPGTGDGGPATGVHLVSPTGITLDPAGNLYIADRGDCRLRRVDAATKLISTVAGTGNPCGAYVEGAPATSVGINPSDVELHPTGDLLITTVNRILRVSAATGLVTTVAGTGAYADSGDGGPATLAGVFAFSIAVDAAGDIFLTSGFPRVRRIDAATGIIDTYAGGPLAGYGGDGGPATSALLNHPRGLSVAAGGALLIAEDVNGRVRAVGPTTRIITTRAGDGVADGGSAVAAVVSPIRLAYDPAGNLHVADHETLRIRRIDAATGIITTVAGNGSQSNSGDGGPAIDAGFSPDTIAFDGAGHLFIGDKLNARVRRVDAATGIITTVAGTGEHRYSPDGIPATQASIEMLQGIAVDRQGNLYIGDGPIQLQEPPPDETGMRIRRVDAATGIITTAVGARWGVFDVALDPAGNIYFADVGFFPEWTDYQYFGPQGNRIYRVDQITRAWTVVAGDGAFGSTGDGGPATEASVQYPTGLAVDGAGNLYFLESGNHRIRKVDAATGIISTLAGDGTAGFTGDGGLASRARLSLPLDIAIDPDGDPVVADYGNNRVRIITSRCDKLGTPPGLEAVPRFLWPPNHRMVPVEVTPSKGCSLTGLVLTSLWSSEPDDAPGGQDGRTTGDIAGAGIGTGDTSFSLRAERSADGGGRLYTATYEATGAQGRVFELTVTMAVPHDIGGMTEPLELTLSETPAGTRLDWPVVNGAVSYNVIRGDLVRLRESGGGVHLGTVHCVEDDSRDATTAGHEDTARPEPGAIFFYLAEYEDATGLSSYGEESAPRPRDLWSGGCR